MLKKVLKRIAKGFLILLLLLVVVYLLGPRPRKPILDDTPMVLSIGLEGLDTYVQDKEAQVTNLKINNQAEIVWIDSVPTQTKYSIVYLHGFSASHAEGDPIHRNIAKRYGANLYLSRLARHGINDLDIWAEMKGEELIETTKEAIAIGKKLGEKVILMGCSTGLTYGLYLAANDPDIVGIVSYSPNIDMYDPKSALLAGPWGLQLARWIVGSKHREYEATEDVKKYWMNKYRIEGLIALKMVINQTMVEEVFQKIKQPLFLGYYYKNEEEQDKTVSVARMLEMYEQLGTANDQKRKVAFPDAGTHVISSKYHSTPEELAKVEKETILFLEEIMKLKPVE
ncbi:MAG: alpha/beta hydrolase [Aureispira sp.]|nr:alpha/beta hydrolase [Aureispira sp.]